MLIDTYTDFLNCVGSEFEDIIDSLALNDDYRDRFRKSIYDAETLETWDELNLMDREEIEFAKNSELDPSILPDNFYNE